MGTHPADDPVEVRVRERQPLGQARLGRDVGEAARGPRPATAASVSADRSQADRAGMGRDGNAGMTAAAAHVEHAGRTAGHPDLKLTMLLPRA